MQTEDSHNAVGYGRCADAEAAPADLAEQRTIVEEWCREDGHTLVGWFEDAGVADAGQPMPDLNRALTMIETGQATMLVVASLDRLGSNPREFYRGPFQRLKDAGAILVSIRTDTKPRLGQRVISGMLTVTVFIGECLQRWRGRKAGPDHD